MTDLNTLPQHTEKMRAKFRESGHKTLNDAIDTIIRETLAWAEDRVVPEVKPSYANGWLQCRAQIITRFKEIQGL